MIFLNRKKKKPKRDWKKEAVDEFKKFAGIGEKFNYLGVDMIVTSHQKLQQNHLGWDVIPTLCCDYCDQFGKIQSIEFGPVALHALIKENPSRAS